LIQLLVYCLRPGTIISPENFSKDKYEPNALYAANQKTDMNNGNDIGDSQLEELFDSPDLFLWQFDDSQALFVRMDRNAYRNSIFCDQRILATSQEITRVDVSRLYDYLSGRPPRVSRFTYIFHIAHCGSTLLARALDMREKNIVYREPPVLRQLGAEAASTFYGAEAPSAWKQKLELSLAMLNRTYSKDGPIVIKGNVPANFIIPALLEGNPDHCKLFLYMSLENYLLAVLKSPNHRSWVATIGTELGPAIESVAGISPEQRRSLSIAEAAACLWMVQIAIFHRTVEADSNARTIDAEVFYGEPANTLKKCFELMQQPVDDSDIASLVNSELFSRYSKDPRQSYDNDTRLAQRDALREQLSDDLEKGRDWVNRNIERFEIPSALGKPLVGTAGLLLD
jgi:hypothetical protein